MLGPSTGAEPPEWTIAEHGSFVLGECAECGFRSPARRARYSVASDMRAHEILCHAARTLTQEPAAPALREPELEATPG